MLKALTIYIAFVAAMLFAVAAHANGVTEYDTPYVGGKLGTPQVEAPAPRAKVCPFWTDRRGKTFKHTWAECSRDDPEPRTSTPEPEPPCQDCDKPEPPRCDPDPVDDGPVATERGNPGNDKNVGKAGEQDKEVGASGGSRGASTGKTGGWGKGKGKGKK